MLYELLDHEGGADFDCSSLFMLNVGAGEPPIMSVPIRSQSGLRLELRIQA